MKPIITNILAFLNGKQEEEVVLARPLPTAARLHAARATLVAKNSGGADTWLESVIQMKIREIDELLIIVERTGEVRTK
jgi:hypothetical protein